MSFSTDQILWNKLDSDTQNSDTLENSLDFLPYQVRSVSVLWLLTNSLSKFDFINDQRLPIVAPIHHHEHRYLSHKFD